MSQNRFSNNPKLEEAQSQLSHTMSPALMHKVKQVFDISRPNALRATEAELRHYATTRELYYRLMEVLGDS